MASRFEKAEIGDWSNISEEDDKPLQRSGPKADQDLVMSNDKVQVFRVRDKGERISGLDGPEASPGQVDPSDTARRLLAQALTATRVFLTYYLERRPKSWEVHEYTDCFLNGDDPVRPEKNAHDSGHSHHGVVAIEEWNTVFTERKRKILAWYKVIVPQPQRSINLRANDDIDIYVLLKRLISIAEAGTSQDSAEYTEMINEMKELKDEMINSNPQLESGNVSHHESNIGNQLSLIDRHFPTFNAVRFQVVQVLRILAKMTESVSDPSAF